MCVLKQIMLFLVLSSGRDCFQKTIGIINNACSQSGNHSHGASTIEINNDTFNVVWSQADFTEIYKVLQKVIKVTSNGADLLYVNSTDRRLIKGISNVNTTIIMHLKLKEIDQENNVTSKNHPVCQLHVMDPKDNDTCSVVTFGKNYFYEEAIAIMVEQILAKLQWKSMMIFYENSTEQNMDRIMAKVNEYSVVQNIINVDSLRTREDIWEVLDLIHGGVPDGMANITIVCYMDCARRILKEANGYDALPENFRRTALRDHTFWFVVTSLPSDLHDLMNASSVLDNVLVLNLNVTTTELVFNYTYNQNLTGPTFCRTYPLSTLMWKENSDNGTTVLLRKFENIGEVETTGKHHFHSKLFPNIDYGFNKRNLLVTTFPWPLFTERIEKNGSIVGYFGFCVDLLDELAGKLNFTYTYTEPLDKEFGRMFANRSWSGMIGQLERREVDLMVSASSIQGPREQVMDYTHPFYYDTTTILIKRPDENKMFTLAKPFRIEVTVCIIFVLPVSAFLLFIIEKLSPYYKIHGPDGRQNYQMSFWYMFGALLTQGGESLPNSPSGRAMITFFWLFSIIMVATYSGNLIAFLTVTRETRPFDSLAELVEQDDYKWGIVSGTYYVTWFQESPFEVLQKVWAGVVKFNETDPDVLNLDPERHIDKLYKEKYAYIGDKTYMDITMANNCELVTATEEIPNMSYGIGLPNNSLYTKMFSDKVLSLEEAGILQTFTQKHWPITDNCQGSVVTEAKKIRLIDVQAAFIVIGVGIVLGIIVLFFEKVGKHLPERFCMKKEHRVCESIDTVPGRDP